MVFEVKFDKHDLSVTIVTNNMVNALVYANL